MKEEINEMEIKSMENNDMNNNDIKNNDLQISDIEEMQNASVPDLERYLQELTRNSQIQAEEARMLSRLAKIRTSVLCVIGAAFLIFTIAFGVKAFGVMQQAATAMTKVEQLDMDEVNDLMADVDNVLKNDSEDIAEALEKIADLDIESLNIAISSLSTIVSVLAGLMG